jgi:hypothetical protein
MSDTAPLSSLKPGSVFRTADGKLWQLLPHVPGDTTPPFYARGLLSVEANFRSFPADIPVVPIDLEALERRAADAGAVLHDYCTNGEGAYSAGFLHGFEEGKGGALGIVHEAAGKWHDTSGMSPGQRWRCKQVEGALLTTAMIIRALRPAATHAPPYRRLLERCREAIYGEAIYGCGAGADLLADIDAALAEKE